jgi:LPS-assembly protein
VGVVLLALPMAAHAVDRNTTGLTLPEDKPLFDDEKPLVNVGKVAKPSGSEPVTMEADAVAYDKDNSIAVAHGNIIVTQGGYVLHADKLTYYLNRNLVVAEGNVSVLQPTGDVFFADKTELQHDMEVGVIHQFKARMTDDSTFAAHEARKVDAATTKLRQAVYTPCHLCEDAAPFWQMKASHMKIDEKEEEITYRNARMEFGGVPVFYTPYLSQPTPDSAAASGFLTPEYSTSSNLGRMVKAPYYWRISEDKDVLLTPWYMSEEDWLLQGDYRQLTDNGDYSIKFSGTDPQKRDGLGNKTDGNEFRGHIYAKGEENLSEDTRIGFDINRATDDTYLRRYGFGSQRVLFSRIYGEMAEQRNFGLVQGLSIQGLRSTDDSDTTPLVVPTVEGYYETAPYASGIRLHAYANAQSLSREIGADQDRLSMTAGGSLPYVTDDGQVLTTTLNLRQDLYNVDHVTVSGEPDFSGGIARTIPQAALQWEYPLIKSMGRDSMTIEPIVLAVAQPNGGNPVQLDNEDNTLIELSDTNLFSLDRMPGLDTVDSGSRIAYGFRTQYLLAGGESIDALLGQNYSFSDDTPFPNSVKPGQNASDIIGRVGLYAAPVELTYRFGLDNESLVSNRNEVTLGFNKPWLTLYATYRSLDNNRYLVDREEGTIYAATPVTDEWSIFASARRDLSLDQMIATSGGLIYHNECFSLMLQGLRNYTRDRDIEPDTSITLRVGFKNLGEFGD